MTGTTFTGCAILLMFEERASYCAKTKYSLESGVFQDLLREAELSPRAMLAVRYARNIEPTKGGQT